MADLIGIGLSGLRSHQTALSVTGNNVANTNTAGYSRQEAIFTDNQSLLTGAGYVGRVLRLIILLEFPKNLLLIKCGQIRPFITNEMHY